MLYTFIHNNNSQNYIDKYQVTTEKFDGFDKSNFLVPNSDSSKGINIFVHNS